MNVQSISIVPEVAGCNQRCKFCIARMTPKPEINDFNQKEYLRKLEGALMWAKAGGAQTAIITSKGETLLSDEKYLIEVTKLSKRYFGQIDLHTNGALLTEEMAKNFYENGLTNITLSVPSLNRRELIEITEKFVDYRKIIKFCREIGLVTRLSCIVNKSGVKDFNSMLDYIRQAKSAGARQIVFRELWIPKESEQTNLEVYEWSKKNIISLVKFRDFIKSLEAEEKARYIFTLPWGEEVFDIDGMNITCATCTVNYYNVNCTSESCDRNDSIDTIKSVVFLSDGHLYSTWEFEGSIIM